MWLADTQEMHPTQRILTAVAAVSVAACAPQPNPQTARAGSAHGQAAVGPTTGPASPDATPDAPASSSSGAAMAPDRKSTGQENLQELLVDVGRARACDYLGGRFLSMTANAGTSFEGGVDATIGTLWIRTCRARETAPRQIELTLEGKAWKWLDREQNEVGAQFEVSQYLRFAFDASVAGHAEFAYAPNEHVATVWFKPSGQVTTEFRALQNVEVDEDGLWSEVVGTAAVVVGKDPDQKANQKVASQGERKLKSKAASGFSYAYDLCTSRSYTKTGILAPGELPEPAVEYRDNRDYLVNSDAVLHEAGLLLVGPFEPAQRLVAEVTAANSSATIDARLVCHSEATKLADAFLEERKPPAVRTLSRSRVPASQTRAMTHPAQECPSVLVLELEEPGHGHGELKYSVYYRGERREPLARCHGADAPSQ